MKHKFLVALILLALPVAVFAQSPTPFTAPTDPKELMLQAATYNGLSGDSIQPWHLKASFQILDDTGGIKESGIYEDFWVSEKKFKRSFTSNSFSITDYGTEKGKLRVESGNSLTPFAASLDQVWIKPIMNAESIPSTSFSQAEREFGNVKLNCVTAIRASESSPIPMLFGNTFCFTPGDSILRMVLTGQGGRQVNRNRILAYQGRAIAGDVAMAMNGKFVLKAHVDSLEALTPINEADFVPPLDAKPITMTIGISGGVMAGMILHKVQPIYPMNAKISGVQGTVVLRAQIDKSGKIASLDIVSGPKELQEAAREAVRQWVYRPYLLNGNPVIVDTQINVVFSLGR